MQCPQTDMAVFPQFRVLVLRKRSNSKAMFSLSFDSNHSVLLAQFAGVLSSEDIKGLDNLGADFPGFDRRWLWHLSIQLFVFGPKTSEASVL
jgi:hypothetical protein